MKINPPGFVDKKWLECTLRSKTRDEIDNMFRKACSVGFVLKNDGRVWCTAVGGFWLRQRTIDKTCQRIDEQIAELEGQLAGD